ncbi:MAG: D-alanyl-D-alanine carboxypeptidase family protein [Acidimicrobiales bacterium]|nr:D-alanyl-D-alanine carboxypeptidase family protein [Acidimicrobiales bacterium]
MVVAATVLVALGLVVAAAAWGPAADTAGPAETITQTPEPRAPDSSTTTTDRGAPEPAAAVTAPTLPPISLPDTTPLTVGSQRLDGPVQVVDAGGIVVHERLAPFISTLLAQADMDGVALEGSGYRDIAAQRRLRAANCPNPVRSAPGDCSPPTALPGTSLHESGLAIDFTSDGELITDPETPAYRLIAANAGWLGLRVHPEEPWHWSYRP